MLEACSLESGGLNLALKGRDTSRRRGSSKSMGSANPSSASIGQASPSTATSRKSTGIPCLASTCSPADSRARTSASPTRGGRESKGAGADCGRNMRKRLGFYDPNTRSLRTFQRLLGRDSTSSLLTLPKRGTMRSGSICALPTSGRSTGGRESLSLPTLDMGSRMKAGTLGKEEILGKSHSAKIQNVLLPTIGANEFKGSSKKRYRQSRAFRGAKMSEGLRTCREDPIYLNPSFAEVVMGFPIGFTESRRSATPSSPTAPSSSGR